MYYTQIPGENMFDFQDYYTQIAEWLPNNSNIVEVGCADGRSGIFLAEKIHTLGKHFKMYMIDNLDYGGTEQMQSLYTHIFRSGFYDKIELIARDSLSASCKFPDQLLDFVFLDSSHKYEETKAEIRLWSRKIKHGGVLAGHDYYSEENPGVNQAVKEVLTEHHTQATGYGNGIWFTNITV